MSNKLPFPRFPKSSFLPLLLIAASLLLQASLLEARDKKAPATATELAKLSLEDFMQVEVYSASKQLETVFTTAAAVYVITQEDIHKSGAKTLAEALQMAPGVQVSCTRDSYCNIGIRGFTGAFSNKLLVLQDGRTLYDPLFSGVYWAPQQPMLEDIEQIEIIRGPAATLWGVNAVNGVINIKTKGAKETQGGLVTVSGGTSEQAATGMRYGAKVGENGWLRTYGKYFYRDEQSPVVFGSSTLTDQSWDDLRGGFRGDWDINSKNSVTLQGDILDMRYNSNASVNGGNLLGRWSSTLSDTSLLSLQLYYDHKSIEQPRRSAVNDLRNYRETLDTADIELQQTFALGGLQRLVWGTGFRVSSDQLNADKTISPYFTPADETDYLFTAFLQDKVTLLPETLHLILGARAEHNDTTGLEIQPTARLLFTPNEQHTFWSAVSRAVRTPSRAETSISLLSGFIPPATEVRALGNPNLSPEKLIAYEAGYRYQPMPTLSFDLALFYNDYSSLIGVVQGTPVGGSAPTIVPINGINCGEATGKGGELSAVWHPLTWVDMTMAYSYLDLSVSSTSTLAMDKTVMYAGTSPRHQFSFMPVINLPQNVKLTLWLRYADNLPAFAEVSDDVTMDARIAWKPRPNLELSLVGQNLLESKHFEFGTDMYGRPAVEINRSMYGKVTWSF